MHPFFMFFSQCQGRPWRALLPLLCLGTSMVAALADTHAATAASAAVAAANASSPTLTCQVTYAGTTHTVVARPVADPYPVPSVDIAGRFRFKAVMVGDAEQVRRIALYTYLDAGPHPVLLHQAKYLSPYPRAAQPWPLTGQHHVYGGPQERELMYSCTLEGLAP